MTYKHHHNDKERVGEGDLDCATTVMIYVVEAFPEVAIIPLLQIHWPYSQFNFSKSKTSFLRKITSQLVAVIFWKIPIQFIEYLSKTNNLTYAMNQMLRYHNHLDEPH